MQEGGRGENMQIEILGFSIIDCDFSFDEGVAVVLLTIVMFLTMLCSPLWKWW